MAPTPSPLLAYVGRYFLPWTTANAKALEAGEANFIVELPGGDYAQAPQKYHARSLAALKAKYAAARGAIGLSDILVAAGCLENLG